MAWIWNVAEASDNKYQTGSSFQTLERKTTIPVKIPREEIKKNIKLFLIQSISAAAVFDHCTFVSSSSSSSSPESLLPDVCSKHAIHFLNFFYLFFVTLTSAQRKHEQFIKRD